VRLDIVFLAVAEPALFAGVLGGGLIAKARSKPRQGWAEKLLSPSGSYGSMDYRIAVLTLVHSPSLAVSDYDLPAAQSPDRHLVRVPVTVQRVKSSTDINATNWEAVRGWINAAASG
jgi:hypothetical protein